MYYKYIFIIEIVLSRVKAHALVDKVCGIFYCFSFGGHLA